MMFSLCHLIITFLVFVKVALAFDAHTLLALVNQQRQNAGVPALTIDPRLTVAAERHTLYQAAVQMMTHDEPNRSLGQRISEIGYGWSNIGENVAAGFGDEVSVMNAWMNSPEHRSNILNPVFTQTGVAYDARGSYWTQEFATPMTLRRRSLRSVRNSKHQ